jgi:hypothetical protein
MVMFARDESVLFRTLLFDSPSIDPTQQHVTEADLRQMAKDPLFIDLPKDRMIRVLEKMSVVTHGFAALITGEHSDRITTQWVADWLEEIGEAVIAQEFEKAGVPVPEAYSGVSPVVINPQPPEVEFSLPEETA